MQTQEDEDRPSIAARRLEQASLRFLRAQEPHVFPDMMPDDLLLHEVNGKAVARYLNSDAALHRVLGLLPSMRAETASNSAHQRPFTRTHAGPHPRRAASHVSRHHHGEHRSS